jgi:hypothetical protein
MNYVCTTGNLQVKQLFIQPPEQNGQTRFQANAGRSFGGNRISG